MFFNICRFLDRNHKELIAELTEQMMKASQNMEYEKAADLRDKIQAVKDIEEHQKIINTDKQNDKDVIALAREESVAFCEVFFIRNGKVIGRESYKIDNTSRRPPFSAHPRPAPESPQVCPDGSECSPCRGCRCLSPAHCTRLCSGPRLPP